jgi:cytochrome d ubiquinol oxidase subunit II
MLFSVPLDVWLPVVWALVLATAVGLYVILDGFDLGVGILFAFEREEAKRDMMMRAIAPFWDGNETWLILGGGGLFVAFPAAYAMIMPAMYVPVILMLLALVFRGVAFEFRFAAKPNHGLWDVAFAAGSATAAFCQGVVLGGLVQGITVADGAFAGGPLDVLTPFSVLTGVAVMTGYALNGAGWLMLRTSGDLARQAAGWARTAVVLLLGFIVAVSFATGLAAPQAAARWFETPELLGIWIAPLAVVLLAGSVLRGTADGSGVRVFTSGIAIFLMCFIGLGVSLFPNIVPPDVTVWEAAGNPEAQLFMLVGVAILLPVILGYTIFVYRMFWGRLTSEDAYE